jgi:hypothetical protein
MNFIFFYYCFILPVHSLTGFTSPKICIHCKYCIPDNINGEFSKCSLFPTKKGKINFLVTGNTNDKFYFCEFLREDNSLCGETGKYYQDKHN